MLSYHIACYMLDLILIWIVLTLIFTQKTINKSTVFGKNFTSRSNGTQICLLQCISTIIVNQICVMIAFNVWLIHCKIIDALYNASEQIWQIILNQLIDIEICIDAKDTKMTDIIISIKLTKILLMKVFANLDNFAKKITVHLRHHDNVIFLGYHLQKNIKTLISLKDFMRK